MSQTAYPKRALLAAAAALVLAASTPARADSIDGDWCKDAQHFTITGPKIVTPGGAEVAGSYSRHGFSYTVPSNEPGAGSEIVMQLRGEQLVDVLRQGAAAPEQWRRCKVTS